MDYTSKVVKIVQYSIRTLGRATVLFLILYGHFILYGVWKCVVLINTHKLHSLKAIFKY